MFYVYVLKSDDNQYVGSTNNLKRRLAEHNAGQNISTKPFLPWDLIFYEAYISEDDAYRRERYLKTTQGRRSLKLMLRDYIESLSNN